MPKANLMVAEFSLPIKVYIEDTDAGGIVYHANYLKYMERARTEFISQLGYDKPALLDGGLLLVVHSMTIDFVRAATLAETLLATAAIDKVGRAYVVFKQSVNSVAKSSVAKPLPAEQARPRPSDDGNMLCRAQVKIACVQKGSMKPAALPDSLRRALLESQTKPPPELQLKSRESI